MTDYTREQIEELVERITPGNWQSTHSVPADGFECFWLRSAVPFPLPSRGFRIVEIGSVNGPQNAEQDANARLIAAAPDLARAYLDALDRIEALLAERAAEYARGLEDAAQAADWHAERPHPEGMPHDMAMQYRWDEIVRWLKWARADSGLEPEAVAEAGALLDAIKEVRG